MDVGPMELLLILAVVVIIFGVGKLPEVGGALGKSIREFRKATTETDGPPETNQAAPETQRLVAGVVCPGCGASNSAEASFCGHCGSQLKIAPTAAGVLCPHCSASNRAEAKFCASCGSTLAQVPVS
jgi:sec-independent protein translocase protein TatA